MYFLGIDLGTTGCKSCLFDESFQIIAEAYVEYPLITKTVNFIEQDADLWWKLVKEVISETVYKSKVDRERISALCVSSQGISFVPVDSKGNVLSNAISWLDTRASEEAEFLRNTLGEKEIFNRTGKRTSPGYSLPKMMWIKKNHPDVYKRIWKFMMGLDFITYRLTGKNVTDHSIASGTMAYNVVKNEWDKEILDIAGIDIKLLPEVKEVGSVLGFISKEAALETGLSERTTIVLGAQDQKCAALGAGIGEGICTISLGTASAISVVSSKPELEKEMRIPCFALTTRQWFLEAVIITSTVSLKWARETLFSDKSYSEIDEMVAETKPGSNGIFFYPHFEGAASPYWNFDVKGFLYGMNLSTSKGDILRSIFEGIAYQIRLNIEILEELSGKIEEIRVFGGGAKSDVWCRIISTVTGKKVKVIYTAEAANLGAAAIAAVGIKRFADYKEIIMKLELIKTEIIPSPEEFNIYSETFNEYKRIQDKILK